MTNALVPMANGVEEMEAVIIIDVLRRARWNVVTAAIDTDVVVASRGVRLLADTPWTAVAPDSFDMLILPGGAAGVATLKTHAGVIEAIQRFCRTPGKIVAAICAAPLALQAAGVLRGRRVTCHPAVSAELVEGTRMDDAVVSDDNLVTSQGPGTTFEFALTLVAKVDGRAAADALAKAMILHR
jgi:4-methyl-5(b-hydroxyethyl)-thiazole monophosphate biosynthesis